MTEPDTERATLEQVTAELGKLGAVVDPKSTVAFYCADSLPSAVILVERVEDVEDLPDYCVHGYASCTGCGSFCYLGSQSVAAVTERVAAPLCLVCAHRALDPNVAPMAHLHDNLRSEGPHD